MTQSDIGTPEQAAPHQTPDSDGVAVPQSPIDQREEAAKAIRFMAIKAAIFILIPVVASALAVIILL